MHEPPTHLTEAERRPIPVGFEADPFGGMRADPRADLDPLAGQLREEVVEPDDQPALTGAGASGLEHGGDRGLPRARRAVEHHHLPGFHHRAMMPERGGAGG